MELNGDKLSPKNETAINLLIRRIFSHKESEREEEGRERGKEIDSELVVEIGRE